MKIKPRVMNWVRSQGMGGRDLVEVYVYGPTRRKDEGVVGHDMRVRPTRLGPGPYTMVVDPDSLEPSSGRDQRRSAKTSSDPKKRIRRWDVQLLDSYGRAVGRFPFHGTLEQAQRRAASAIRDAIENGDTTVLGAVAKKVLE